MPFTPRAVLPAQYPTGLPTLAERALQALRALVHLDRGDGTALCRFGLKLMVDDSYDPGPATCARCITRARRFPDGVVTYFKKGS